MSPQNVKRFTVPSFFSLVLGRPMNGTNPDKTQCSTKKINHSCWDTANTKPGHHI